MSAVDRAEQALKDVSAQDRLNEFEGWKVFVSYDKDFDLDAEIVKKLPGMRFKGSKSSRTAYIYVHD